MARSRVRSRRPRTRGFAGTTTRPKSGRALIAELLGRPQASRLGRIVGWIIRARAELTLATILLAVWGFLVWHLHLSTRTATIAETATILVILIIPGTRRAVSTRSWCITDRHRIRACFTNTRTMTPTGAFPLLMWASPSPTGERIRVWLRAGQSVNDLDIITTELAAACYAAEAKLQVSNRVTTYVIIHIIRRDPLTGKRLVRPHLADLLPTPGSTPLTKNATSKPVVLGTSDEDTYRPLPDRDSLIRPTPPAEHPTVTGRIRANRPTKASTSTASGDTTTSHESTTPETPAMVRGVDGTDVSDYI